MKTISFLFTGPIFSLVMFPDVAHLGVHVKIVMAVKEEGWKPRTETGSFQQMLLFMFD